MSSMTQLFVAGLAGVFVTISAMYLWTFIGFWYQKPMLEPHGFNLMLSGAIVPDPSPLEGEALALLKAATTMKTEGKREKALKLFQQASALSPHNPDILLQYGEFLESHDIVKAEHLYNRALSFNPSDSRALTNRKRALPKVKQIDRDMLSIIDDKRRKLFSLPAGSLSMKRAVREAYYQHIYHSNAIEGNTMTLSMTRAIVETRMAVAGKSIIEHNEVIGLDEAMKYINSTLVRKSESISVHDILQIHKRVLGHAHPLEAGIYRVSQVYVGEHVPPPPSEVERQMSQFNEWLLSRDPEILHPIEFAAIAHYKLVYIHPFTDGNGRTARLLMNTILMRAGFPPVIIRFQDRHRYYEHLNQANHGDIRPFIRFVAACTERTIDAYLASTTIIPLGRTPRELTDAHVIDADEDDLSFHDPTS
ncbi:protein adenylyltransferase Fic [Exaiptasia diaphana]|uniref:protein adenylyltransferase n=1 Tax=Exaiptasia diaphana TaxID=2652724 RepID=A0A913X4X9_EXADI|nr:protein adenylyltransferase Fic [Exaiptasia diaphana]